VKVKTTLYLDRDLKEAVERAARERGTSEAEVIRAAIARELRREPPKPRGGFLEGPIDLSERVDDVLAKGFGDWRQ
jgi:hypothetical protein